MWYIYHYNNDLIYYISQCIIIQKHLLKEVWIVIKLHLLTCYNYLWYIYLYRNEFYFLHLTGHSYSITRSKQFWMVGEHRLLTCCNYHYFICQPSLHSNDCRPQKPQPTRLSVTHFSLCLFILPFSHQVCSTTSLSTLFQLCYMTSIPSPPNTPFSVPKAPSSFDAQLSAPPSPKPLPLQHSSSSIPDEISTLPKRSKQAKRSWEVCIICQGRSKDVCDYLRSLREHVKV